MADYFGDDRDNKFNGDSTNNIAQGNDVLDGGADDDTLYGDTGYIEPDQPDGRYDDIIYGGQGDDTIYGEAGNDRLYADIHEQSGFGFDTGAEKDVVSGGAGDDTISVGIGDDADGGEGTDTLTFSFATSGHDITLRTSDLLSEDFNAGSGTLSGFEQVAAVRGSKFSDRIVATADTDGGGGNDHLTAASAGVDLIGGAGDDVLVSARGANGLSGGDGIDTASYGRFAAGVTVSLGGEFDSQGNGPDGDYLVDIENVTGSRFADRLYGNSGNNLLVGKSGDDTFKGYGGDDVIKGGTGANVMDGDVGSDTYIVDNVGDVVHDDPGDSRSIDTVRASVDFVLPDFVEDLFLTGRARSGTGNDLDNRIIGSHGADVLSGLDGKDPRRRKRSRRHRWRER